MEKKQEISLFRKFLEFAIGNGFVIIIGLISSPIITRIILPDEYGKFSMFTTITNLLILIMMMGIDQAYIRYYNEEDAETKGKLLKKSITLPLIFNLCLGVILILMYKRVSMFIIGEVSFGIVVLTLVHSTINIISNFSMIHIRMKQRGKLYSLLNVINKLFFLIFTLILFVVFRNNYIVLVIATILSNLLMGITAILYEKNDWFNKEEVKTKTTTKELVYYGYPFIFSMAITWVFQSIDKISLKMFSGYAEIGLYAGAMTIIGLLNVFQSAFTVFWTPVAYERYSQKGQDETFFVDVNKVVSICMLLLSIGLIACKDIIIIILGPDYSGAQFIYPLLVFMPIMYTISETTVLGINFKKKTKYHIYIAIFSATANIIGNLLLVPKYGAKGAAISTGLAYVVFFVTRTYFSNKIFKIKYHLARFYVCIVAVYVFAIYSSMYKFDLFSLVLTIITTSLVLYMYRDTAKKITDYIIELWNNRPSK